MASNFRGYYMKCNGCTFQNPSFAREGFKFAPKLILVTDSGTVASGKAVFKVLPHTRRKIWCKFPPMTPEQFRTYAEALRFNESGAGMNLTIEAFDEMSNQYVTDTYYHNDIVYTPVAYNGQRMIQIDDFELIGH
jgi:hypothetical protein